MNQNTLLLSLIFISAFIFSSCCKEKVECLPSEWVGIYEGVKTCKDSEDVIETIEITQSRENGEILLEDLFPSEICGCKSKFKINSGKTDLTFKFTLEGETLKACIHGTDVNGIELDCEWEGTR